MAMGRAAGGTAGGPHRGAAGPPAMPAWAPPPLPGGVLPGLTSLPMGEFKPGQRNAVNITMTGQVRRRPLQHGSLLSHLGTTEDSMGKYGPIALYVGGTALGRASEISPTPI